MANQVVKVELIANPTVTRMMTEASLKANASKWRLAGTVAASQEVKKKDVEPVVDEIFAFPIGDVPQETTVLSGLQAQYKAKTGKDPDKRWGVNRLTKELQ